MKPAINLNSTIKRMDNLVSCDLDGETALMSVDQGKYYGLDPIGSRIWALLEEARPVVDLCALLLAEFEVEPARCQQDVLAFLHDLAQDNLIKVVDEPPA
jgi:hypothetical protein